MSEEITVYVVMGNDFPDSVFSTEALAEAYIAAKKAAPDYLSQYGTPRIYWRVYDFVVDKKATQS